MKEKLAVVKINSHITMIHQETSCGGNITKQLRDKAAVVKAYIHIIMISLKKWAIVEISLCT